MRIDTDSSDAITADPALAGDGYVEIRMNGSTQGGIKGSYIKCTNIAVDLWYVEGTILCSGNVASPWN